jgi:hypothetical protein
MRITTIELTDKINSLLIDNQQTTLAQVVEKYPITKGLSELIAYVSLINNSDKYFVNEDVCDVLLFDAQKNKYLKIPQIIYCR